MMVYNTQNYWLSGFCPLSGILNTRKHVLETGSDEETDPVSEMLCFLVFRIPDDGQNP
jgi:hypothetical protein